MVKENETYVSKYRVEIQNNGKLHKCEKSTV